MGSSMLLHLQSFLAGAFGHAHGRNTDKVTSLHPRVSPHPALIDPHLATANDAIDMRFGHAFEVSHQKVVQALAGIIGVNLEGLNLLTHAIRNALYNVFH
jgi:hypothetical protein